MLSAHSPNDDAGSGLGWWHYGLRCRTRHQCLLMRLTDFGK
jgi:hypothetical protein